MDYEPKTLLEYIEGLEQLSSLKQFLASNSLDSVEQEEKDLLHSRLYSEEQVARLLHLYRRKFIQPFLASDDLSVLGRERLRKWDKDWDELSDLQQGMVKTWLKK